MSGLFTSFIILLSLGVLTPAFTYIPKASLAAIIICALMVLIEYDTFIPMYKVSKLDVLTCFLTFISSLLLGMEYGIGVGTACSIAILLYKSLSSQLISELKVDPHTKLNYILLKPTSGPLQFPMIDVLRSHINSHILEFRTTHHVIVLDCLHWTYFDYSGISAVGSIIKSLQKHNKYLVLLNCSNTQEWAVGLRSVGVNNYNLFCNSLDDFDSQETDLSQVFLTTLLPLINSNATICGLDAGYQNSEESI
jgi:sodium-independent sulfate anion transporter 11